MQGRRAQLVGRARDFAEQMAEFNREATAANRQYERDARLAKKRAELEEQGYVYVGKGWVRANAPCPCKSGAKFKRCCASRTVRVMGATFVKGVADHTGLKTDGN